jgi:hypothetical protein
MFPKNLIFEVSQDFLVIIKNIFKNLGYFDYSMEYYLSLLLVKLAMTVQKYLNGCHDKN